MHQTAEPGDGPLSSIIWIESAAEDEQNPWKAPVAPLPIRGFSPFGTFWPWEFAVVSFGLSTLDAHHSSESTFKIAYLFTAYAFYAAIHYKYLSLFLIFVMPTSLYLTHLFFITCGYEPPFVERDYLTALWCFLQIVSVIVGLLPGLVIRVGFDALRQAYRRWFSKVGPYVIS